MEQERTNCYNDKYYTTKDVLDKVGITRPTLYKWIKDGKIPEVARDRNDFRLFTANDIKQIISYKNLIKAPLQTGLTCNNKMPGGHIK